MCKLLAYSELPWIVSQRGEVLDYRASNEVLVWIFVDDIFSWMGSRKVY